MAQKGEDAYYHAALHDFKKRLVELEKRERRAQGKRPPSLARTPEGVPVTYFRGMIVTAVAIVALWLDADYGQTGHQKKETSSRRGED